MRSIPWRQRLRAPVCLLALAFLPACVGIHRWQKSQTQRHREVELADVAKSWCQTIRASQVIPVYPLTEDLQPGDVFLVRRTIEEQAEEYKRDGFLALDYHLMRLDPAGYGAFYSHSVLANAVVGGPAPAPADIAGGRQDPPRIPAEWMRPGGTLPLPDSGVSTWDTAPRAAFPSYSFSTQSGAGFNLAVPVQGVPVGLALLGNQAASGTITISEARTLGIDMLSMWLQLRAETAARAAELRAYTGTPGRTAYLRVVTRIYLAGAMDVSIGSNSSAGAGLDVGVPRPIDLLTQGPPEQGQARAATTEEFTANLQNVNDMLAADATRPGGSLRVTMAGGNTVGLRDTFDPPLVVGYLGFDCEILPGGVPGPPVPTLISLTDAPAARALFASNRAAFAYDRAALSDGLELLRSAVTSDALPADLADSGRAVERELDGLSAEIDEGMPTYQRAPGGAGVVLRRGVFGAAPADDSASPYERFKAYRMSLELALNAITAAQDQVEFRVLAGEVLSEPMDPDDPAAFAPLEADRQRIAAEFERVASPEAEDAGLRDLRAWLIRFWSADAPR